MKKQSGFSVVELLLILILVGIVGTAGWLVLGRQKDDDKKQDSNSQTAQTTQKSEEKTDETNKTTLTQKFTNESPKFSYSLPEGWSNKSCENALQLYPSNDKPSDCNDRTNLVYVSQDAYAVTEAVHCMSQQEVTDIQKTKAYADYQCSTLTINGKQVIKESYDQGMDEESNKVVTVNYTFVQEKPLRFRYGATKEGVLKDTSVVEEIVKSVTF